MSAAEDYAATLLDLRRENEQLRERLAAAEHELLLERQPWRRFLLASESELIRLLDIARGMHPRLIPPADQNFLHAIVVCFTFLTTVGRLEHVDETHYIDHFTDQCVDWARWFTAPIGPIDNHTLFVAAIMHSDIPYRLGTANAAAALGIANVGAGSRASGAWRKVLDGSMPLRPAEPPKPPPGRALGGKIDALDMGPDRFGRSHPDHANPVR